MSKDNNIWLIAYVNRDFIKIVEEEISRYENLNDIEVYIPTIKLLKKKAKGKNVFEELPLLFNYGFFKLPKKKAINKDFLIEMRHRISCIYGWVKDPSTAMTVKPNLNVDNKSSKYALPGNAIATDDEVVRMVSVCNEMSIYDNTDIARVDIGSYIILEGYPFEGVEAKILEIDNNKKEVKVELQIAPIFREARVSFENVFYTVYKGFENRSRERSLEDMGDINMIDSLIFKNKGYEK